MSSALATDRDRARVAALDAEILVLERALSALRVQRAQAQQRIESYKYPYPVLTLPNEIVVEIFVHFLPKYPSCPPLTGPNSPFLLTQICGKWRKIASETPILWRAIPISDMAISRSTSDSPFDTPIPFEHQAHLFNLWLSRSQRCPLSIELYEYLVEEWVISPRHATEALSIVMPHRDRWENLVLDLLKPPRCIEGPLPLLRHLDLSLGDALLGDAYYQPPVIPKVVLREAPLLRTVLLNAAAAQSITLAWAQLTSLTLRPHFFLRDCVPILEATINLLHCDLCLLHSGDEYLLRIVLPFLKSLTLTYVGHDDPTGAGFLETFDVPALSRLRVPQSMLLPNSIPAITSFLLDTGCELQELSVTGLDTVPDFAAYREAFPSMNIFFYDRRATLYHGS
ncbi:F-box domain-containing protein [Mycena sanguinolenta]|uniref:F-box domain-containing protein n=1 Tax=Mycena sanguinolenta TaxID=230812 RepID=A0A8H7DCZ7_9AGAR|nr:F-box domain-containing protein [Mycena sanguinolenta]